MSETKFGTWRDTAMHLTHIPSLLRSLERRIVQLPEKSAVELPKPDVRGLVRPQPMVSSPAVRPSEPSLANRSGIPPPPEIVEPFLGAWLKVGDEVEGRYQSKHNEWYRGIITRARGHQAKWDVVYHDDDKDFRLCRQCVRPFDGYREGEELDHAVDGNADNWRAARILTVHGDDTYDIELVNDDQIVRGVQTKTDFRRFKTDEEYESDGPFWLGEQVEAQWYDEEQGAKWYLATIVNVNGDDTYGVEYFDGDYERHKPSSLIRSLS